jgi:predicted branched-subunit amino acid permease
MDGETVEGTNGLEAVPSELATRPGTFLFPEMSRQSFRDGVRALAPLSFGITIWGIVTGVAMVRGGMPLGWAIPIGLVAPVGSAQLAVLPLVVANAPIPIVLLTATLVNLRFVIFSAAMRDQFAHLTLAQRYVAAYVNGDFAFTLFHGRFVSPALSTPEREATSAEHMGFYWGVATLNFIVWHAASTVGMLIGSGLPTSWGLDLAATLALLSVAIPMLAVRKPAVQQTLRRRGRRMVARPIVAGAVASGIAAVLTARIPLRLGLVLSIMVGVIVAMLLERTVGSHE